MPATGNERMPSTPSLAEVYRDPWLLLATVGGIGLSPKMPGTVGALAGIPLSVCLWSMPGNLWPLLTILLLLALGVPVCRRAADRLADEDPQCVVYDEWATMPLVFALWQGGLGDSIWPWVAGFLLHRVFDILKPPPIRSLERIPRGWGIMLDDVAAAIGALVVLEALRFASSRGLGF